MLKMVNSPLLKKFFKIMIPLFLFLALFFSPLESKMPNYYDEYYAHWKLVPISYALESNEVQSNSSVFINYLNGCFFNHTVCF